MMKRSQCILFVYMLISSLLFSQNATDKMIESSDLGSIIGSYGEVHYNCQEDSDYAKLDVHRMVLLFGYKFSDKLTMATELEIEHVKEVYVEQAFLNYAVNNFLNIKTGLILSPMGIINSYHEPPTFNGVERPNVDKYIIPSTWREIGFGVHGRFLDASINYQFYLMNGFNGYDEDGGVFSGSSGLRSGRQKGAESYMSSPNFTGRIDFYGIPNLKLGVSGYFGDSQSKTPDIDSTIIGVNMLGGDMRYTLNNLELRGQYTMVQLNNTKAYNGLTGSDLGNLMVGYYFELGYNVLPIIMNDSDNKLITFVRYENYNTHADTKEGGSGELLSPNPEYNRTEITIGTGYKVSDGAVFKADYQLKTTEADEDFSGTVNLGIGWWF